MSYDPERQYRCTIIRGKAKGSMDDLLPTYAHLLEMICPCNDVSFPEIFNKEFSRVLPAATEKTLNNHRTEICGKLFGMYYKDDANVMQISERTLKLLEDSDQPSFFKDLCYKFQFPNGMDKVNKVAADIDNGINLRQCAYILELMRRAEKKKVILTIDEVGYYVLNSKQTLQGVINPEEVLGVILFRRKRKYFKKVRSGSYGVQHIRETFNYMELANLIRIKDRNLFLNRKEKEAIDFLAESWGKERGFDVKAFDLDSVQGRKKLTANWQEYYSKLAFPQSKIFDTTIQALTDDVEQLKKQGYDITENIDTTKLGDDGEVFVYNYEKNRVKEYNSRLVGRVLLLGKTRGLGFDIQSVNADNSDKDDYVKYIEVKTTKRISEPGNKGDTWNDVVSLTRNEWLAADQHRHAYSIYRVYFTPAKVVIFAINDPISKDEKGIMKVVPEKYRVDFTEKAGVFLNNGQ